MDGLIQLLREQAVNLADLGSGEACDWNVEVNSASVAKVTAATKQVSRDQEDAWRTATELRDGILGLGYRPHGECVVGIVSKTEADDEGWEVIVGWRGYVSLVFRTDSPEPAS